RLQFETEAFCPRGCSSRVQPARAGTGCRSSRNTVRESLPSPGPSWGRQGMRQAEPGRGEPIGPLDWLQRVPVPPAAPGARLGWVGREATRFRAVPGSDLEQPPLTHHRLFLLIRPPAELDLLYDGVKRHVPPPAGAISVIPAGTPARWRWSGPKDTLNVYL